MCVHVCVCVEFTVIQHVSNVCVPNTVLSVIYAGKIFMLIHHFEPNFIFAK